MNLNKYVWTAAVGLTLVLLGTAAGGFLSGGGPAGDTPARPQREADKPMPLRDPKLADEFKAHAATFQLTISTYLRQRDGEKTRWLLLQVPKNVLPAGAADTVAQISRAQAIKLIDALAKYGFFRRATQKLPPDRATSHLTISAFVQKDGDGLHYWLRADVDLSAERFLRACRACLDGRAAKEMDVLLDGLESVPLDLGKANLRFVPSKDEGDAARPGLFALADPGKKSPPLPELYGLAENGKAARGSRVLVGRLPAAVTAAGRLRVFQFFRIGDRIEADVSCDPQPGEQERHTVYLRADLPELQPGRYKVQIHFAPARGAGKLPSLTCTFDVPEGKVADPDNPARPKKKDPALEANLAWHEKVAKDEIRVSWFPDGKAKIAMICRVDLAKQTATTAREVHDWATQASRTQKLSPDQAKALRELAAALPPSQEETDLLRLLVVSVRDGDRARTYRYSRFDLPPALTRLNELAGANK